MTVRKSISVAVASVAGVCLLAGCAVGDIFNGGSSAANVASEDRDRDEGERDGDAQRRANALFGWDDPGAPEPLPEPENDPAPPPPAPEDNPAPPEPDHDPAPPPPPEPEDDPAPPPPGPGEDDIYSELPEGFPTEVPLIEGSLHLAEEDHDDNTLVYVVTIAASMTVEDAAAQATQQLTDAGFTANQEMTDQVEQHLEDIEVTVFVGDGEVDKLFFTVDERGPGDTVLVLYMAEIPIQ